MTKTGWAELSPKQQWDIQVALRGPDAQDSEPIKWFTTSVIRGAMSGVIRVGGTINQGLKMVVVPNDYVHSVANTLWKRLPKEIRAQLPQRLLWNSGHFFHHVVEAASHMDIPVVLVDSEKYWGLVETNNQIKMANGFAEYLESNSAAFNPSLIKEMKAYATKLKGGEW